MWGIVVTVVALLSWGCGDDDGAVDATASTDGAAGTAVASPDIAWLEVGRPPIAPPVLTPCPDGWHEVMLETEIACQPYPEGGRLDCPPGHAHFPGEPACTRVGSECPAGGLPVDLPVDVPVVYVRAGATAGDGSAAAPWGSFLEFPLGRVGTGTVVGIGVGDYSGELRVPASVTLWGACAEQTTLRSAVPSTTEPVVTPLGAGVGVRNLSISDSSRPALRVDDPATAVVSDVVVDGVDHAGLIAAGGGSLEATSVLVQNVRDVGGGDSSGVGLRAVAADLTARRVLAMRNQSAGILASRAGGVLLLSDAALLDTRARLDGDLGNGLAVIQGARADVSRTLLADNHDVGAFVTREGSSLVATDVVIRDTRAHPVLDTGGRGVVVQHEASADLTRVLLWRNRDVGVFMSRAEASLRMTDAIVRATESRLSDSAGGRGLDASRGASAELERAVFARNRGVGVRADSRDMDPGFLRLLDLVVRDNVRREDGLYGRAISIEGSRAEAARVELTDNEEGGVVVAFPGGALDVTDLAVRDTVVGAEPVYGRGFDVLFGGDLTARAVLLDGNADAGMVCTQDGSRASLTDAVVRSTLGQPVMGFGGDGMIVQQGCVASLARVHLSDNRSAGVLSLGGGSVSGVDVAVLDTLPAACDTTSCVGEGGGHGLASIEGSRLDLTRFRVRGAALCGLYVAAASDLDLAAGEVSEAIIGACIQTPDYDIAELTANVTFRDNGTNLDTVALPVPNPDEVIDLEMGPAP